MSELKWPIARYVDPSGLRRTIRAEDLSDGRVLEEARLNFLTDESEQTRIYPRTPDGKQPHFYSEGQAGPRIYTGEQNPAHDSRVAALTRYLQMMQGAWTICYRERFQVAEELTLPSYRWQAETTKVIGDGVFVRHDILGAAPALADSYLRPVLAIEVINTHYPEEAAFQAMLLQSERSPYVVHFDHVRRFNMFLEVDGRASKFFYQPNSFYVKDGAVYRGHRRTEIRSSVALQIQFDGMLDEMDKRRVT